jgi:hypothetical protein
MTIGLNARPAFKFQRMAAARPRGSRLVADSRAKKSPARRLRAPGLRMCWMGDGGGLGRPSSNLQGNARPAVKFRRAGDTHAERPW